MLDEAIGATLRYEGSTALFPKISE
jgi:hypothetical protein